MRAPRKRGCLPHTIPIHAAPRPHAAPTRSARTQRPLRPHAAPTRSSAHTQRPHAAPTRTAHTQRPHARPHCSRCPTHSTHTHNHTVAATAAVSAPGGAAGTQRSSGAAGDGRRRVRRVQRTPAWAAAGPRDFAGPTDLAAADRQQGCSAIRPWERPPEAAVPYEPSGRGSRTPDAVARQALGRAAVRRAPA